MKKIIFTLAFCFSNLALAKVCTIDTIRTTEQDSASQTQLERADVTVYCAYELAIKYYKAINKGDDTAAWKVTPARDFSLGIDTHHLTFEQAKAVEALLAKAIVNHGHTLIGINQ